MTEFVFFEADADYQRFSCFVFVDCRVDFLGQTARENVQVGLALSEQIFHSVNDLTCAVDHFLRLDKELKSKLKLVFIFSC
jgi:hypothetical protein